MRAGISRYAVSFLSLVVLSGLCLGQERFDSGKYKGFTKYSAFAIVELQDPFSGKAVKGVVLRSNSNDTLSSVLIELRDAGGKI
jgi:hypothetical protein